jgi:hypothetical protein
MFKPPGGVNHGGDEEDEKVELVAPAVKAPYDGGLRNLFRINQSGNGKGRSGVRA